ncbi:MAG: hypothetical protein H7X94_03245, partial [Vallitaleaceae bacterium]|nr:hypothetical protein [Vallitaleaceae bacterium]
MKQSGLSAILILAYTGNMDIRRVALTAGLICIIGLLLYFTLKNYYERIKITKIYKISEENLRSSNMELAAANQQLISSDQELIRQFIELQEQKENLKLSRERYRLAAEGAEVGIWDVDVAKREIYISKKGKEISGFDQCGIG